MIEPRTLFSERILDYPVDTSRLGRVSYVNLDNAATTPPLQSVEVAVRDYLTGYGSVHRGAGTKSILSTDIYEQARENIKAFVGAPSDSYVMYSGNTTGAINMAAYFFAFLKGKVAVSEIEHSSSWLPWVKTEGVAALEKSVPTIEEMHWASTWIQRLGGQQVIQYHLNEQGEFDLADIEQVLARNQVKVFVLTASSNVTGYCPPIREIGKLVHKYHAYYLVDACQYLQHHPINMVEDGIDFIVASGHKFYAPYGGGFLIGPKAFLDEFLPYQIGGGNLPYITAGGQFLRYENQLAHDPGTPNAIGAVSMAVAFETLGQVGLENIKTHEHAIANRMYDYLTSNPRINMLVPRHHLNTVLTFTVKDADSKEFAARLNDEFGIGVRAGSFCAYNMMRRLFHITDDSSIADAVQHGDTSQIPGMIRASCALCNTLDDADRFCQAVETLTRQL